MAPHIADWCCNHTRRRRCHRRRWFGACGSWRLHTPPVWPRSAPAAALEWALQFASAQVQERSGRLPLRRSRSAAAPAWPTLRQGILAHAHLSLFSGCSQPVYGIIISPVPGKVKSRPVRLLPGNQGQSDAAAYCPAAACGLMRRRPPPSHIPPGDPAKNPLEGA